MPIVEPQNKDVKDLEGVHLFHSPFSNCSQRARLVLAEKKIPWQSHKIELMDFEHLTPEYQAIHPKGMVPALVHDGTLVTESNDIISYLDEHFDAAPLMPQTEEEKAAVAPWMKMGADLQTAIKTLTYERIFRKKNPPSKEGFEFYKQHQRNSDLVEFWRQYLEGFDPVKLEKYEQDIRDFLKRMDEGLEDQDYLTGDQPTLADFSAVVNVHRAKVLGIDLAETPNVARWYETMRRRPSFQEAILAYVPD